MAMPQYILRYLSAQLFRFIPDYPARLIVRPVLSSSIYEATNLAPPGGDFVVVLNSARVIRKSNGQVVVVGGSETAVVTLVVAALESVDILVSIH